MKSNFDFHDKYILQAIGTPISNSLQLIISYGLNKALEIKMENIINVKLDFSDSLKLLCKNHGVLNFGYIEDKSDIKQLYLSGYDDYPDNDSTNVNWGIMFEVERLETNFIHIDENLKDKLINEKFFDINKIF